MKGEFKPSGTSDILTTALETPEHSGRVRGVGSFITPSTYFNLPRGRRNRVTKDELLARDKRREEEFAKRAEDYEKKTDDLKSQIAELKALIGSTNLQGSPLLSDKASCRSGKDMLVDELNVKSKPVAAKELMVDEGVDDCVAIDNVDPPPPAGKKVTNVLHVFFIASDEGD